LKVIDHRLQRTERVAHRRQTGNFDHQGQIIRLCLEKIRQQALRLRLLMLSALLL
jgi:hypothetical protein